MPDGTISLPLIHPIQVVGLTIDQVDSAIKKAYTETDEPTDQAEDKQENPIRNAAKETTDDVDQPKKKVDDLLIQDPIPSPAIELENQMDRSGILRKNSLIIVTLMRPMKPASAGGQRQSDR
ncbi:MAG: polysaccharide biosynthesis/export family protein [Pirellulaceae bacterium]